VSSWSGRTALKSSCVEDSLDFSVYGFGRPDDLHHPVRDWLVDRYFDLHSENVAPSVNCGDLEFSRSDHVGQSSAIDRSLGRNRDGFPGGRWCRWCRWLGSSGDSTGGSLVHFSGGHWLDSSTSSGWSGNSSRSWRDSSRCEWLGLRRAESVGGSRLFLGIGVDGIVTWLLDALVKSIGVEKLALLLSRVSVVSSIENSIQFRSSGSSLNLVVNARIIVS